MTISFTSIRQALATGISASKPYIYGGIAAAVLGGGVALYWQGRSDGEVKAENKQLKVNHAAQKRKEAVAPADSKLTIERLSSGSF